jgi:hypothetical protein
MAALRVGVEQKKLPFVKRHATSFASAVPCESTPKALDFKRNVLLIVGMPPIWCIASCGMQEAVGAECSVKRVARVVCQANRPNAARLASL